MPQGTFAEALKQVREERAQERDAGSVGTDLYPAPAPPPPAPGRMQRFGDLVMDVGTGVAKDVGETAFSAGQAVRAIPGLGTVTDALARLLGPEDTNPEAAFARTPDIFEGTTSGQRAGKVISQAAHYLLPGGLVRGLAKKAFATAPTVGPIASRLMGSLGRVTGEAASAAGVAGIRGETRPEAEAGLAGALTAAREIVPLLGPLLRFPLVQHIVASSIVGSMGSAGAGIGGMVGGAGGIGAGLGAYNAVRRVLATAAQRATPQRAPKTSWRTGLASRAGAALTESYRDRDEQP